MTGLRCVRMESSVLLELMLAERVARPARLLAQLVGSLGAGARLARERLVQVPIARFDHSVVTALDLPDVAPSSTTASESTVGAPREQFVFGGQRYGRSFLATCGGWGAEQVLDHSRSLELDKIDLDQPVSRAAVLGPWQLPDVVANYAALVSGLGAKYLLLRNSPTGKPGVREPMFHGPGPPRPAHPRGPYARGHAVAYPC